MMAASEMTGRAVLVTGATSGLGKASALVLAKAGAELCIVDVHEKRLRETQSEITALGANVLKLVVDLGKADACRNAVMQAKKHFGRLDALCHVAGLIRFAHTPEMSESNYRTILDVNLGAAFFSPKRRFRICLSATERL